MYDLQTYTTISLSSIAQWKRRWLSNHVILVQAQSIVVYHWWKNPSQCLPFMKNTYKYVSC